MSPKHCLTCLKLDRSSAMLMYYFFLNKLSDLTETFFFLAKKSYRQISFLHLYHHVMVITAVWLDIFLQPGKLHFIYYTHTHTHTRILWKIQWHSYFVALNRRSKNLIAVIERVDLEFGSAFRLKWATWRMHFWIKRQWVLHHIIDDPHLIQLMDK